MPPPFVFPRGGGNGGKNATGGAVVPPFHRIGVPLRRWVESAIRAAQIPRARLPAGPATSSSRNALPIAPAAALAAAFARLALPADAEAASLVRKSPRLNSSH